ncbi:MAG: hypothetical protein IPG69_15155 [Flavobacteriales bacterium]|nr:hypothetical protein [Flavobacteriales bacterium]
MNTLPLIALSTAALLAAQLPAQEPSGDRKVRIEITTNENGKTSTVTREFDMNDERSLEDALNELGVLDEIKLIGEGENLVIDMRRMKDGGALEDMSMAMVIDPGGMGRCRGG